VEFGHPSRKTWGALGGSRQPWSQARTTGKAISLSGSKTIEPAMKFQPGRRMSECERFSGSNLQRWRQLSSSTLDGNRRQVESAHHLEKESLKHFDAVAHHTTTALSHCSTSKCNLEMPRHAGKCINSAEVFHIGSRHRSAQLAAYYLLGENSFRIWE
jgi:hypothetical protein